MSSVSLFATVSVCDSCQNLEKRSRRAIFFPSLSLNEQLAFQFSPWLWLPLIQLLIQFQEIIGGKEETSLQMNTFCPGCLPLWTTFLCSVLFMSVIKLKWEFPQILLGITMFYRQDFISLFLLIFILCGWIQAQFIIAEHDGNTVTDMPNQWNVTSEMLWSILLGKSSHYSFPPWEVGSRSSCPYESLRSVWSLTPKVYFSIGRQMQLTEFVAPRDVPPARSPIDYIQ